MKHILPAVRVYLLMMILLGLIYPLALTLIGQAVFPKQSRGSLIARNGVNIGSELIAQKFVSDKYFWPRPSATDYNPLPSGGSNLSPTNSALVQAFADRTKQAGSDAPQELLFASASGLDPHISYEAALYQIPRIAKARTLPEETVRTIVETHREGRRLGFIGEIIVNVLNLNLSLDAQK